MKKRFQKPEFQKMNILYLHQYFILPSQAGGGRSYWISQELIRNDHSVTMLTSRNIQKKLIEKVIIDGINVIYIRNSYSNKMSAGRRLASFFSFMLISSFIALKQRKADLVFATSTPLTIGFPALIVRFFRRVPYIFEVRDLWPEFPIQMGAVKSKLAQRVLRSFEHNIYNKSLHIIALSPGMKNGILKSGVDSEKVSVIPNMCKNDMFYPREPEKDIFKQFSLSRDKFKVIHFGAMGPANRLEYLIEAAKILQDRQEKDVEIIILGDGMVKEDLQEDVRRSGLEELVHFIDSKPISITSDIVNSCECTVVSFKNLPVLQTNSPNKLFDSLAAGKPVIVNSAGWTKEMVEQYECGMYVDPDIPEELVNAILLLKSNKELMIKMGLNARSLAELKYDKKILCREVVEVIERFRMIK